MDENKNDFHMFLQGTYLTQTEIALFELAGEIRKSNELMIKILKKLEEKDGNKQD